MEQASCPLAYFEAKPSIAGLFRLRRRDTVDMELSRPRRKRNGTDFLYSLVPRSKAQRSGFVSVKEEGDCGYGAFAALTLTAEAEWNRLPPTCFT